jgi:homoserine O-acetyltransferase
LALIAPAAALWSMCLHVASLGDLQLENGSLIRNCTIGYRTLGRLNAAKSNAVLLLPWYQGRSWELAWQVRRGRSVDASRYFVIAVDALGNGVSSSPSTSGPQRGSAFPEFSVGDIVESEYRLVTRVLQLTGLHAVVGISMGGMQVFEWTTAHPSFVKKGIAIVGSPQAQEDDRERSRESIERLRVPRAARAAEALRRLKPRTALNELRNDPYDHIRQAQAIMSNDVARRFGGSLERAAAATRADLLVVSTWGDREVNPKPAFDFARLAKADVLELDGRCGHQAPSCEAATLWPAVAQFLAR